MVTKKDILTLKTHTNDEMTHLTDMERTYSVRRWSVAGGPERGGSTVGVTLCQSSIYLTVVLYTVL